MLLNEIFKALGDVLEADARVAGVTVLQKDNVVNVGMGKGPTVYMFHVHSDRFGFLQRKETYRPLTEDFLHTEMQVMMTTVQFSGVVHRIPAEYTLPTAYDYARLASDVLQSDSGREAMRVKGLSPLRITEVRNVPFINDSGQFETNPSFDLTVTYVQITESTTPSVDTLVPKIASTP